LLLTLYIVLMQSRAVYPGQRT